MSQEIEGRMLAIRSRILRSSFRYIWPVVCVTCLALAGRVADAQVKPLNVTSIAQQDAAGDGMVKGVPIDKTSPLSVRELRQACSETKSVTPGVSSVASRIRDYCQTSLAKLAVDFRVPSVKEIRCVILDSTSITMAQDESDPCGATAQVESFAAGSASLVSLQANFLLAATDVLFARAQDAVKADVFELFQKRVCKRGLEVGPDSVRVRVTIDSLLVNTCAEIDKFVTDDPANRYSSPVPGLTAIRASARADLLAVPGRVQHVVGRMRDTILAGGELPAGDPPDTTYQRVVLAMAGMQLARGFAGGDAPGTILNVTADSLSVWTSGKAETRAKQLPNLLIATSLIGITSSVDGAWPSTTLGTITPAEISSRAEQLLRTTLISCADQNVEKWASALRLLLEDVSCNKESLEKKLRPSLKPLISALAELPTLNDIRDASNQERRAIAARQAKIFVPILIGLVADAAKEPRQRAVGAAMASLASHLAGEDYAAAMLDVIVADTLFFGGKDRLLKPGVAAALTTVADIALASDVDGMRVAMENAISPPSRYLAKRDSSGIARTLWLNAYVGASGGYEWVRKAHKSGGAPAAGIALPIGVEVVTSPSASIFFQALDLGQVLNYRLGGSKDSVESAPQDLSFRTVFSPGLSLVVRPGKAGSFFLRRPYAFLVGASYAPALRSRTIGDQSFTSAGAIRATASLVVDVPILP